MDASLIHYVKDYKTAYLLPSYDREGNLKFLSSLLMPCRERYLDYYTSNKRIKNKVILLSAPKPKWERLIEESEKIGLSTEDFNLKYYSVKFGSGMIWVSEINIPKRFSYNIIGMYLFLYLVRQTLSYNRRPEPDYEILLTCYLKYHKVWFRRSKFLTDAEYEKMLTYNKGPISILRGNNMSKAQSILFERMAKTFPDDMVVRRFIAFFNQDLPEGFMKGPLLQGGQVGYTSSVKALRNLIISKNKKGFHLLTHPSIQYMYFAKP